MGETLLESLFRQPLRLIEDIKFAVLEVDVYHQECKELYSRVDHLASFLHTAVRMVRHNSTRFCEHPTRRIVDETSHVLESCCSLMKRCGKGGLLRRLVTITTAPEFKKAKFSVEDAIANVNWLLNCVADAEVVSLIGMPPITSAFPNLSVVWSLLSKLQGGTQELQEAAAIDLALMASASGKNGQFIIEEGGIPLLLKALHDGTLQCKVMAATTLHNLAVNQKQVQEMVQQGVIPACVRVLEQGARQVQVKVIWALAEMLVQDEETQMVLGNAKAIMHMVALMLETMNNDNRPPKAATSEAHTNASPPTLREVTNSEGIGSSCASSSNDRSGRACDKGEGPHDKLKMDLQVQVTRMLCLLAASNLDNSRKIAETRALLGLANLVELGHGEVQQNAVMTIMELAAVAEENADFRKFAFKLTSPAAKAALNQLHRIIIDDSVETHLQVCCIKAVGSLARAFSAKDSYLIKALVLKLSNLEHFPIVVEAINALLKFTEDDNFLCQAHSTAILEVPGLPFLVQIVAVDNDKSVQFPAIHLLTRLAWHVGRTKGEAFQEAAALSVLKSVASSASTLRQYAEFSAEDDIRRAIYHLEFCQAGKTNVPSFHKTTSE